MTFTQLEKAIRDIFIGILPGSTTVIWANENGPRPELPYLLLNFATKSVKVGSRDELRNIPATDTYRLYGHRHAMLSVNAYGKDALQMAEDLKNKLQLASVLDALRAQSISVLDESDTRDLSVLVDTKIEKRAQFDLTLGYTVSIDETITPIEKVELENNLVDPTDTFEVDLE